MQILNQDLKWGDLPGYVKKSFKGAAKPIHLPTGFKIFTLSNRPNLVSGANKVTTEWWSPVKRYHGDPGLTGRFDFAKKNGLDDLDVFRDTAAYANKKTGLRYVVVSKLRVPAYGFFGKIRRQGIVVAKATNQAAAVNPASVASISMFQGYQIYIPGLEPGKNLRVGLKRIDLYGDASKGGAA